MRHPGLTIAAVALATAALSACNKSANQPAGGVSAPSGPVGTLLSDEDAKKAQASLPAPYNTADLANGQAKFAFCSACHTITPGGPNMTGPNLHGVVGRKAGAEPNFNYSDAVKNAGFTWDAAHLDRWLSGPQAMLQGTKMTFPGLKDPKDRTDVIAYLMVNSAPKP